MEISKFGKGALLQPTAVRDYRLELATAIQLPTQFSLKDNVGKVKNQNGSGSCVGQAFAAYAELLNTNETGQKVELSARDIYSLIYVEPMGAYLKDAAAKICNSGVVREVDAPSYDNGKPPEEFFMRKRGDITSVEQDEGMTYVAKSYVTWDSNNIGLYKQAIVQGKGAVAAFKGNNYCWSNSQILIPDAPSQIEWSHAVLLVGYDDATRQFTFLNSWGEGWGDKGFGYLPYEYIEKGYASNPFTLVDLPNETYVKMLSVLKNLLEKIVSLLKSRTSQN